MISVEITGQTDVAKALGEISKQAKNRIGQRALITALTPILDDAKRRAPKDTGNLAASIGFKHQKFRNGNQTAILGPRKGFLEPNTKRLAHKYAHLVEFGHLIAQGGRLRDEYEVEVVKGRSENGRVTRQLRKTRIKKKATGTVSGFVLPMPFLRPAFEAGKDKAVKDIARVMGEEIELTAKRTARRRAKQVSV